MSESRIAVFGEVLFDHFPGGEKVLGGAPFNVAWHLRAFACDPLFLSRVGEDPEGAEIQRAMSEWKLDPTGLQIDPELKTGSVRVDILDGEPRYTIVHPTAWDAIEPMEIQGSIDFLYHGTLALRDPRSSATLETLTARQCTVFLDVNLRPPWWDRERVLEFVDRADWLKLNEHELRELAGSCTESAIPEFLDRFNLRGLVLTRGDAGAELLTTDGVHLRVRPEETTGVVDTVGAGDAFSSVMILGLSRSWPLNVTLERAQQFASAIVARRGATVSDTDFYRRISESWALEP